MRLATLAGLYVAVVLSAQIGAQKFIRLPFTHLVAPGGVYAIGVALALVQLAHYSGSTRRDGAINAQLLIGLGFLGSASFAGYIALLVHSHPGVPGQEFDRVVGSTRRIVAASLAAFIVSETVDNLVGAPLRAACTTGFGSSPRPVRAHRSTASSSSCSRSAGRDCTSSTASSWARSRRRS
jgi:uncharacterized PurR-regulated membrane protein YhhQ (DUF165 family)